MAAVNSLGGSDAGRQYVQLAQDRLAESSMVRSGSKLMKHSH